MTPRTSKPSGPWWAAFIEKHGIATFILIAGGWYVSQTVINPLVATAQTFVSDIRECNVILQNEIMTSNKQTMDRWNQIFDMMEWKRSKIEDALARLETIQQSHDKLHTDLELFRALLTRPESVQINTGAPK
jgi:hypothetical protein